MPVRIACCYTVVETSLEQAVKNSYNKLDGNNRPVERFFDKTYTINTYNVILTVLCYYNFVTIL
jgi:hypothetical protein